MAYAFHYQKLLGCFDEAEFGKHFDYEARYGFPDDFRPEFPHMIHVADNQTRLAKVLKTVVYVLCDEDDMQRWAIKRHREFAN